MTALESGWARTGVLAVVLLPLSLVFSAVAWLRRTAYARGWLESVSVGVPVVVVGNITAGGSGKTPLVIWLVGELRRRGFRPGVVSRGYGGSATGCVEVGPDSPPDLVGDEPLLIRIKSGAPVVVGRDRVAAARRLLAVNPGVDVIVSDDGLQHYRLARDVELAVVDAATGLGNGWPLPAGPLREPAARLERVDAVIQVLRGAAQPLRTLPTASWQARYAPGAAWRLAAPEERRALADLPEAAWIAATGIGRPQGFFGMLAEQGLRFTPKAFPDHHAFRPDDLPADGAVLMTEKDAVKCRGFAGSGWWAVELDVAPEPALIDWLDARLKQLE